eukprot:1264781-Prymnesium_polylepis.2
MSNLWARDNERRGETAAHFALANGHPQVARFLLSRGSRRSAALRRFEVRELAWEVCKVHRLTRSSRGTLRPAAEGGGTVDRLRVVGGEFGTLPDDALRLVLAHIVSGANEAAFRPDGLAACPRASVICLFVYEYILLPRGELRRGRRGRRWPLARLPRRLARHPPPRYDATGSMQNRCVRAARTAPMHAHTLSDIARDISDGRGRRSVKTTLCQHGWVGVRCRRPTRPRGGGVSVEAA